MIYILFIYYLVERSVYKDLVCLLQENRYLSEQELRKKVNFFC